MMGNRRIILIMMLLVIAFGIFAQTRESVFEEGVKAYENGDFQTALENFSSLVHKKIVSADLYYNIGNCYYRLDDLGRAILNYKRALRIQPGHGRALNSLEFALTRTQDKQQDTSDDAVSGLLTKINRVIGLNMIAWVVATLLLIIVVIIAILIIFYSGREKSVPLFFLSIAIVLFLISGIYGWARLSHYRNNDQAVLLADTAIGYSGPGRDYTRVFTIHEGHIFEVMKREAEWSQVKLGNGLGGWIQSQSFEKVVEKK